MHEAAAAMGAEAVLVSLPGLCRREALGTPEYGLIVRSSHRVTPANFPLWADMKRFVGDLFQDVGRRTGMKVIDVQGAFASFSGEDRLALFSDEMHASREGAEEIAQAVARAMVQ